MDLDAGLHWWLVSVWSVDHLASITGSARRWLGNRCASLAMHIHQTTDCD